MRIRFYRTVSGRSPVEDFLREQSDDLGSAFVDAMNLLASGHVLAMPLSRNLSTLLRGFHELRLHDRAGAVRVFYWIKTGEVIHVLHAFRKKTQELPRREIELALRRAREV